MNRHKSYFGPSLVCVAAAYLGLFVWVRGFSFSNPEPLPEGVPVEWMELSSEPTQGQPEPSSTPALDIPEPAALQVSAPKRAEAPAPEPEIINEQAPAPKVAEPLLASAAVTALEDEGPAPLAEPAPEAWTAPESEVPVLAEEIERPPEVSETESWAAAENFTDHENFGAESEPAPESRISTLSDKDFFAPGEFQEEPQQEKALIGSSAGASHSNGTAESLPPAFSNPYADPNAPPLGRQGVLDARSLAPAAGNPPPSYPASDRLARREGVVVLLGYVTPSGRLARVTVEQEGSSAMTQESFRTFKNYRYRPGQAGWVRQTFRFTLKGAPEEIKATLRGSR